MTTSNDNTYNGWTNYPTWNVKLWMDNDQGSYEYWQERANDCFQEAEPQYEGQTKLDDAIFNLASEIECYYSEYYGEISGLSESPFGDLLGWALNQVNYREIAENMLSDLDEVA